MQMIGTSELKQKLDSDSKVLLIDVLPKESFAEKHIPGAVNIPLKDNDQFIEQVQQKAGAKDREIIVYCASTSCPLSEQAAQKLEQAGFHNVIDYDEGVKGWFEAEETGEQAIRAAR